jgi:uncharacterized protein YjiS (DUF1127 family)
MRPYYFDIDQPRMRHAAAIVGFERVGRSGWPPPHRHRLADFGHAALTMLGCWRERIRQRRQLARLDLRLLRDIGISRDVAEWECNKPFWRR